MERVVCRMWRGKYTKYVMVGNVMWHNCESMMNLLGWLKKQRGAGEKYQLKIKF